MKLASLSLLTLAVLAAPSARAETGAAPSLEAAEGSVRRRMLEEFKKSWNERDHAGPRPGGPAELSEEPVEFRWDHGGKPVALLRMTRRTLERYRELYRRWEEDSDLRRLHERLPERYLGELKLRDALALRKIESRF